MKHSNRTFKTLLILISTSIFSIGSAFAQGEYLDKTQKGFSIDAGFAGDENGNGLFVTGSMSMGPFLDLGIGFTRSFPEYFGTPSNNVVSTAAFHPLKTTSLPVKLVLETSIYPGEKSYGQAVYSLTPYFYTDLHFTKRTGLKFRLGASYSIVDGYDGVGSVNTGFSLFLGTSNKILTVTPSYVHTKYAETFGIALGIIFISHG